MVNQVKCGRIVHIFMFCFNYIFLVVRKQHMNHRPAFRVISHTDCYRAGSSPPIRRMQVWTEGSRGKYTCSIPNSIQDYRNSLNVTRVGCVFGHIVYIYFVKTLEDEFWEKGWTDGGGDGLFRNISRKDTFQ